MDIKFGTDGWRAVMARDFTFETVRKVAQAIAEYVKSLPPKERYGGKVIIGYDQRFLSDQFAGEVARVLHGNKLSPIVAAEILPTPAISYLTQKEKALGVMITASHNPPSHNGIKIKVDGRAAPPEITQTVESYIGTTIPVTNGEIVRKSYRKQYLDWLKSSVPCGPLSNPKKPVVVDYLFGCASGLLGELLGTKKLIELHNHRDPTFGGLNPEPIEKNLEELIARVKQEKALVGIAFDGDADRIGIVDDLGNYLTPCQVFPMLIDYLISEKGIRGKIVQSVSMGFLSSRIAKANNLAFEELPVGFKYVAQQLASGEAAIGGEESGGYSWKGSIPERDGLLTALLFLEMCHKLKKTPSQIWEGIESKYGKSCFLRVDYPLNKPIPDKQIYTEKLRKKIPKKILDSPIRQILDVDGIKVILENDFWVLIRPSGTEPLVRTYAETDSPQKTKTLLDLAKKWCGA